MLDADTMPCFRCFFADIAYFAIRRRFDTPIDFHYADALIDYFFLFADIFACHYFSILMMIDASLSFAYFDYYSCHSFAILIIAMLMLCHAMPCHY